MKKFFPFGEGIVVLQRTALILPACLLWAASSASASVILPVSGTSAKGVAVEFEAEMGIAGDTLTIELRNVSPGPSLNPDDLLASFYFDIVDGGGDRPALSYVSAVGDTYLVDKNHPDTLLEAGADIMAVNPGDDAWVFKAMDPSLTPFAGFGLGTVGNSGLGANGFPGNVTDGFDYGIYRGDVQTQNLTNKQPLVKESAVFTFSGASGFSEDHISRIAAFGLGTAPDSVIYTPEPGTMTLVTLGLVGLLGFRRSRQA